MLTRDYILQKTGVDIGNVDLQQMVQQEIAKMTRRLNSTGFILKSTASRRTKQRWDAHITLRCNDKCRFCRREKAAHQAAEVLHRLPREVPVTAVKVLPTANEVLTSAVAENYQHAVKRVASKKAAVEVNQAALIAGMMVYHKFNHHPCILLNETQPGFWSIEMQDGRIENEVPAAILTPLKPNILTRIWLATCQLARTVFYKDVEVHTDTGWVTEQRIRKVTLLSMLFTAIMAICLPFIIATLR